MNKHVCLSAWAVAIMSVSLCPAPAYAQTPEAQQEPTLTAEEQAAEDAFVKEAQALLEGLTPEYGEISLPSAGAALTLPDDFYYLNSKDAQTVLEKAWRNPPDSDILGMIFANDTHAYNSEYAVVITFDKSGYVSDEDASELDFSKMLKTMQKDTKAASKARVAEGYGPIELLGWADTPNYDQANNRLSWAKSLRFGEAGTNTLNYNLRFLGRRGVLEFNYVAEEAALETIKSSMPMMIQMANFTEGNRYTDFNATTDKVASYGVAGLIAGGLVAKKIGLLGVLLLFLKKGWIIILAAAAFGKRFLGGLFGRKDDDVTDSNTIG